MPVHICLASHIMVLVFVIVCVHVLMLVSVVEQACYRSVRRGICLQQSSLNFLVLPHEVW